MNECDHRWRALTVFAEIVGVTRQSRSATVVAAVGTQLIRFPRKVLVELIRDYPKLRERLSRMGLELSEDNLQHAHASIGDSDVGLAELLEGDEPGLEGPL